MDKAKTIAMPVALLAFAAIIGVIAVVLVNVSLTSAQATTPDTTPAPATTPEPTSDDSKMENPLNVRLSTLGPWGDAKPSGRPDYNHDRRDLSRVAGDVPLTDSEVSKPVGYIRVEWDAPLVGTPVAYRVERGVHGSDHHVLSLSVVRHEVKGDTSLFLEDWDVVPGISYVYRVTAFTAEGYEFQDPDRVKEAGQDAPLDFESSATAITLTWEPYSVPFSGVQVYKDSSGLSIPDFEPVEDPVAFFTTEYVDSDVTSGQIYRYMVEYLDLPSHSDSLYGGPVDDSNVVTVKAGNLDPSAPTTFEGKYHVDRGYTQLMWDKSQRNHSQVVDYEIQRRDVVGTGTRPFAVIGYTREMHFEDWSAQARVLYDYRVVPMKRDGNAGTGTSEIEVGHIDILCENLSTISKIG